MREIRFESFRVGVPEKSDECYTACGDVPKKVKDFVKVMNGKRCVVNVRTVAGMIAQEIHQQPKEIN